MEPRRQPSEKRLETEIQDRETILRTLIEKELDTTLASKDVFEIVSESFME